MNPGFWRGRRVLVTGNTGFKGSWLSLWLEQAGASVTGFADSVPTQPSLYELARVGEGLEQVFGDIRDFEAVAAVVAASRPEVIVHMAAQPFVRRSFREPRETYETNVMGTVNVLEAARTATGVDVVVSVSSDKCYDNWDQGTAFVEDDPKGGHDPYSSSKGCAELVADAYLRSYFGPGAGGPRLGSARAGNVIGGGDWGEDRLIPDLMRAAIEGTTVRIRNPEATRPWQHVLNPLSGYLRLAEAMAEDPDLQGGWNFGPGADDVQPVRVVIERIAERWDTGLRWELDGGSHPHEAATLMLDATKARQRLGWEPGWDLQAGLDATVEWHTALRDGGDLRAVTLAQIDSFAGASR